jgi:hypothetical protein
MKYVSVHDKVSFTYKGNRRVKGLVISVSTKPTGFVLLLETDYIGKNEQWYKGEKKYFNLSEVKNLSKY